MEFTDREIASYFWLTLFFLWCVRNKEVRESFEQLVRIFCQPVILTILTLAVVHIALSTYFLALVGLWTTDNLKTTILWTVSFALFTLFDINKAGEDRRFFKKIIRDVFAIAGALTFIVELYSFSFPVELVAVPCVTVLGLMYAVSDFNPEHRSMRRVLGWILGILGFAYFGYSLYRTLTDLTGFATINTAREFGVPIALSLLFLPFLWSLMLYTVYQKTFMALQWSIKNPRLRQQAKLRAILAFGPRVALLQRWAQATARFPPDDIADLKKLFIEVRTAARRERNPPLVHKEDGWSPYIAKDFLKAHGLVVRDYYHSFEDEWSAGSNYFEVGDAVLKNNLAYYLNGNEHAVTELKLMLNINDPENADTAEHQFQIMGGVLLVEAFGVEDAQSLIPLLNKEPFDIFKYGKKISLSLEKWHGGIPNGYSRKLTVRINQQSKI